MAEERSSPRKSAVTDAAAADESERALGRMVAKVLPGLAVGGAIVAGAVSGAPAALLVLAAGALVGTIAFLWASLRTLSGDAALPIELEIMATRGAPSSDLAERKIRVLRAIKDIENEHAIGKIDDDDFHELLSRYRDEAKGVLRAMDSEVAPKRVEAERLVREYLAKKRIPVAAAPSEESARRECDACHGSNEPDATFCKHCGAKMKREADVRDATS